jgi:hypothetical protein
MIVCAMSPDADSSSALSALSNANFRVGPIGIPTNVPWRIGIDWASPTKPAATKLVASGKLRLVTPRRSTTTANGASCAAPLFGASSSSRVTLEPG